MQRELNLGSVQYYPNPSTTMKESVTRKDINEHRKAIGDLQAANRCLHWRKMARETRGADRLSVTQTAAGGTSFAFDLPVTLRARELEATG